MGDRYTLRPDQTVDPDTIYSVGREDTRGPWLVLDPCRDAVHAAALDRAAPEAVRAGVLGTRRGAEILAAVDAP